MELTEKYGLLIKKAKRNFDQKRYKKFASILDSLIDFDAENPAAPKEVIPNLYIGTKLTRYEGFDVVINLCTEHTQDIGKVEYHNEKTLLDYGLDDIKEVSDYYNGLIQKSLNDHKKVLVHCYAGKSRSFTIIAIFLLKRYGLKQVLDLFDGWYISPNPLYVKYLLSLSSSDPEALKYLESEPVKYLEF
jgi:hypothetical protein